MMNEKYYVELDKLNKLLERKNKKTDFYNGIYDRYEYPVLTREMIPQRCTELGCALYERQVLSCRKNRGK